MVIYLSFQPYNNLTLISVLYINKNVGYLRWNYEVDYKEKENVFCFCFLFLFFYYHDYHQYYYY